MLIWVKSAAAPRLDRDQARATRCRLRWGAMGRPRVELLSAVRNRSQLLGGSHAQRDVIDLTLIAAARKDGQHRPADALEAERAGAVDAAALSMAA